jgi:hypothetical protein
MRALTRSTATGAKHDHQEKDQVQSGCPQTQKIIAQTANP